MRLSKYLLPTLKELPADADTVSAKLMLRAGLIRKVAAGLYEWLPFGLRVLKKVEQIIREEMDRAGGQEVWLPIVQPKELWEETGRWQVYGKELLRIKDRKDTEFCLAPTAEEVITDLVRREVRSYRELPLLLYQFGIKFRDEIRPRFGVMRAREFYMKDAYSFHADDADLEKTYKEVYDAYVRICERCGFKFRPVEAATGAIGGRFSHEFMVLAETGEETIATCDVCGYAANIELAESTAFGSKKGEPLQALGEVDTPDCWTVEDVSKLLKIPKIKFIKTLFYDTDQGPVVALMRGDHELNEAKLQRHLGAKWIQKASDETYRSVAHCEVGYAGPVGLSARVVADWNVATVENGVTGANKKDKHLVNVNLERDCTLAPESFGDLRMVREGDPCTRCFRKNTEKPTFHKLAFHKGIEVGHVFKLGTKYSESMSAGFLTEKGTKSPFVMGCYGIGVSRIVAAAIEQCHDDNGILWPAPLAPFQVIVLPLNVSEPNVMAAAEKIYSELRSRGVEALLDDRDQRAGVKFKDADLLGIPWRVTVGEKKLAGGCVELKSRSASASEDAPVEEAADRVLKKITP
ncbi:MAG TPA: proline--tRNA ligase [Elusimicrobiota bacterium]|nr:proline--tRNA ligase [Elusimicrobiota bacterium]